MMKIATSNSMGLKIKQIPIVLHLVNSTIKKLK